MKAIKVKNTRNKTESVQIISVELYDASDLRDWAYEHAWSGARDRLEDLDKYAGGWELLFDLIEQDAWQNASGTVTDTYINDTIWFVDEILDDFNSVYEDTEDTLEESKTLGAGDNLFITSEEFFNLVADLSQRLDVDYSSIDSIDIDYLYYNYMNEYEKNRFYRPEWAIRDFIATYFNFEESKTLRENTNEEMKIRTFLVNALEELQTQDVEATSLKLGGGYSLFVMGDDTVGNPEDKVLLVEIIYRGEYVDHDLVMTKDDIDLILELLDTARVNQSLHESKTLRENLDRHVWEGWTVQDFIDELEPSFDMIMSGNSWQKPFKTKEEIKRWAADNQPYYKKSIPEVVSYFTNKLNKGFKESKTLRENKTELNEDYVLGIQEDYDTQWEFDTFILGNDQIIAHGSDDRNARYPIYEALTDLLREHGVDEDLFGTLTEVEELIEELGYYINRLTGYGQGDNYTLVTKEPIINSQHFEDIIFGGNHYTARLYKIGRGRLIQVDSVGGFHIPEPTVEDIYNVVQYFDVLPAYYQLIDIGSSYTSQEFREALDIVGLKDFDTLEESKRSKGNANLTEGAFDELSYNYKEDLAALYSVANFMDYEEYNEEFGTKYRSKRAYERGLYQDLLHIIDGAKASGDLSETDVYNVDDILNANAEFIDILAGILTYFNM